MIPIKVKSNKIFTKETLDKCKTSFFSQKTCEKEGCKGLSMGNGFCRWHGGINTPEQVFQKKEARRKRNNNCNRSRQQLRKENKNSYKAMMETRTALREFNIDD